MTAALDTVRNREKAPSVAEVIVSMRREIAQALPKHMDADRVARLALTVIRKDPALAACKPESFVGALLTASALGLEPGVNGEAYLVAYKGECTLIVGYQGMAKLFWQHPLAQHLDAQAVHEHDHFDYAYGLDPFLTHKPALKDRGPVVAFYAVAGLTSGARIFVVLSPEEVKALRATERRQSIADPMHWMERKTCLRQLFKLLPKSPLLSQAIAAEDKTGTELRRELADANATTTQAITAGPEPVADANGVVSDTSWPTTASVPTESE